MFLDAARKYCRQAGPVRGYDAAAGTEDEIILRN